MTGKTFLKWLAHTRCVCALTGLWPGSALCPHGRRYVPSLQGLHPLPGLGHHGFARVLSWLRDVPQVQLGSVLKDFKAQAES